MCVCVCVLENCPLRVALMKGPESLQVSHIICPFCYSTFPHEPKNQLAQCCRTHEFPHRKPEANPKRSNSIPEGGTTEILTWDFSKLWHPNQGVSGTSPLHAPLACHILSYLPHWFPWLLKMQRAACVSRVSTSKTRSDYIGLISMLLSVSDDAATSGMFRIRPFQFCSRPSNCQQ